MDLTGQDLDRLTQRRWLKTSSTSAGVSFNALPTTITPFDDLISGGREDELETTPMSGRQVPGDLPWSA